jgi:hypothetical protein
MPGDKGGPYVVGKARAMRALAPRNARLSILRSSFICYKISFTQR